MRYIVILCLLCSSLCADYVMESLSDKARVFVIRDFLTDEECDYLIGLAKPALKRSTVVDGQNAAKEGRVDERRTSEGMFCNIYPNDPVLLRIEQRVADVTHTPRQNGEPIQVLCYQKGGEYQPHHDYFLPQTAGEVAALDRGGQRMITVIMYLNTPEAGGHTIFPKLNVSVVPKKGRALVFYDCLPSGGEDILTLHGGAPVQKGEKWIATRWVREGTFH